MFEGKSAASAQNTTAKTSAKGRVLHGVVVSDKMNKTAVVAVSFAKKHAKYQKYFTKTSRFKAHDEKNEYHVGDAVTIQETRPLSKDKRWVILGKKA
ncbi:MAG: 30S ribosomal protein S17 [Patescibacteria group bacterium]|nr:30S ribosomal protein S17 [Patescibacteria group bacterium]